MSGDTPRHGGQLQAIASRFGVDLSSLIDFSASINPDGPPASVVTALRTALERPETLSQYPDLEELRLTTALAAYAGASQQNVLVANGFVQLLDAALQMLPIRTCLVPVPCFVEYRAALERARVEMTPLLLREDDGFRYDVPQLLTQRYDAILIANPQNPAGVALDKASMMGLIEEAARRGTYVLLDEAFIDYLPEQSLTPEAHRFRNLIVFRSVTKCFGIPGLRVAYGVTHELTRRLVEAAIPPWSISTLASLGVVAAVEDEGFRASFRALNDHRQQQFAHGLRDAGLTVFPGAANSLLLRLPRPLDGARIWERLIVDYALLLRSCANFEGLAPGYLRAAVRTESENARLIEAMKDLLQSSSF